MENIKANEGRTEVISINRKDSFGSKVIRDFKQNKYIYIMLIPVVLYFAIFKYGPIYGIQIAFKDYRITETMWESRWVGFKHFISFFNNFYFWRLIRNTLLLSIYELIFAFTSPIILALLLNEVRRLYFRRTIQTITYLPHFISLVVIVGMVIDFTSPSGLINQILSFFGVDPIPFMQKPEWFRTIYVGSQVWQSVGWGSIIYLAAITSVNPELYEAATIDGAGRFKQIIHVTIPGILPTITILFLLQLGSIMSIGYEKIILMYNPLTYETADVISTYVFRKGILDGSFSYSTAIGLFDSIINFTLIVIVNHLSRKVGETSLW